MRNNRGYDVELIREINENLVLRSIMKSQPVSRVEVSRITNLSFSTVTRIINQLQAREFIIENSIGESSGGRKPTLLRVNPHGGYVVGINLDVIETSIALLDMGCNVKNLIKIPTEIENKNSEEVLLAI